MRGGLLIVAPSDDIRANREPGVFAIDLFKRAGLAGGRNDMRHVAAVDPVPQIVGGKERTARDNDCAQLHGSQHELPERCLVAQHEEHMLAFRHSEAAQEVGRAIGTGGHFGKTDPDWRTGFAGDHECRCGIARRHGVEVIESPVEVFQCRPDELAIRARIVIPQFQQ